MMLVADLDPRAYVHLDNLNGIPQAKLAEAGCFQSGF